MDKELKREFIVAHYQNPYHKGLVLEEGFVKANTNNASCIDNIDIQLKVVEGVVEDAYFDGEACAISTSATSILLQKIIGRTVDEVKQLLLTYQNMIDEKPYDASLLGELTAYDEVCLQPNRKKCALLPKETIEKILKSL